MAKEPHVFAYRAYRHLWHAAKEIMPWNPRMAQYEKS